MKPGYLEVVESPRRMGGKGAPRDTVFGVLGHTKMDPMTRSLGGMVVSTTKGAGAVDRRAAESVKKVHKNTEKHIVGPASKTHVPGVHTGMIPFAGQYMVKVGGEVS